MKLKVTIEFRDDTTKDFVCNDFPAVGDWITLFFDNFERQIIPKDAVKSLYYKFCRVK